MYFTTICNVQGLTCVLKCIKIRRGEVRQVSKIKPHDIERPDYNLRYSLWSIHNMATYIPVLGDGAHLVYESVRCRAYHPELEGFGYEGYCTHLVYESVRCRAYHPELEGFSYEGYGTHLVYESVRCLAYHPELEGFVYYLNKVDQK